MAGPGLVIREGVHGHSLPYALARHWSELVMTKAGRPWSFATSTLTKIAVIILFSVFSFFSFLFSLIFSFVSFFSHILFYCIFFIFLILFSLVSFLSFIPRSFFISFKLPISN
jgi:hypothetical protein